MRLKNSEVQFIKEKFQQIFGEGQIYLFGSRVEDHSRGGDIDLFLEVRNQENLLNKKWKFLAGIKMSIGDQKIDIVFNEDENRLIEKEIKKCRILL
ncbi:MAG: nucleotidyltransferase domain-containing protein [Leptospiraceae bacterium]|nr:nucleotidyltransferase domain-containing protein [Leptospiraceae bacterium]